MSKGWIAVDFDGTLAVYDNWMGAQHCGEPIMPMVNRVKKWLREGKDVRIFTARVFVPSVVEVGVMGHYTAKRNAEVSKTVIKNFCKQNLGRVLPITCSKDYGMIELWDDRCVQLIKNTGERVDGRD